jgi:methyltransferase
VPASTTLFLILVAAVGAGRLSELRLSRRHQRQLADRGAALCPEPVFRAMVALHSGILAGAVVEVLAFDRPFIPMVGTPALVLVALATALRLWVIASLGMHWNVRVVRSAALGVITAGPYRFVRHPNYVAVFVELAALPLVHGAIVTAMAGAILHALILHRRIQLEESVLMADDDYRRAFADKPRFVPWPMF